MVIPRRMASIAIPKPSESTTDGDMSIEDIASGVFAQILPKTTGATPAELAEHGIKQPAKEGTRQMVSYLKTIGDRLDQDAQFDGLMNRLEISADTVYDTFKEVIGEVIVIEEELIGSYIVSVDTCR